MATARISETVNANADEVFAILGDFGGIKGELIAELKLHGSGIGCIREVVLSNGGRVMERMENHDVNTRTLTYSIQNDDHPLPFRAYIATLIVRPVGAKQCRVDWFSNFEPRGATEAEAVKFAHGIYTGFIKDAQKRLAA